jgi:hypothetical protein
MVRHHGEGYNWKHIPIDAASVHASGDGKAHVR